MLKTKEMPMRKFVIMNAKFAMIQRITIFGRIIETSSMRNRMEFKYRKDALDYLKRAKNPSGWTVVATRS